jgi:hypothetical protein
MTTRLENRGFCVCSRERKVKNKTRKETDSYRSTSICSSCPSSFINTKLPLSPQLFFAAR